MIISESYDVDIISQIILLPGLKKLKILSSNFNKPIPTSRPDLIVNVEKKSRNQNREGFEKSRDKIFNEYIEYV